MTMDEDGKVLIEVGDEIFLKDPEEGEHVPGGWHTVQSIFEDGSVGVGSKSAVWPWRILQINKNPDPRYPG